jgi:hypothetical protein
MNCGTALEQNQSNGALGKTIEGGLFLRKTPLNGSASGYIYSDSAVASSGPGRHPVRRGEGMSEAITLRSVRLVCQLLQKVE